MTFPNIVTGVLVACALVVTVAVVRQTFWTAPPPPPSSEPRVAEADNLDRALWQSRSVPHRQQGENGDYMEQTPDAGPSRSWAKGPWLNLDPNATLTATGYDFENVMLDSEGRAHLVDHSARQIVVFAPDLQVSHTAPLVPIDQGIRIDVLEGDSIVALDWRTGLASVRSTRTGEAASQFLAWGVGTNYPYAIWALGRGAGFLVAYTSTYTPDNAFLRNRQNFLRFLDRNGEVVRDSVLLFPATEKLVAETDREVSVGPHPFGVTSYVSILAGTKVVHASSDWFAVSLVDVENDAATSFSYSTDTAWVSDADLTAAAARESQGRAAALLAEGRRVRQVLTGVAIDQQRKMIWVGIWSPPGSDREWAAFDTSGVHLASVALPGDFVLHGVWQDRLIGVDYSKGKHDPVLQSLQVARPPEPGKHEILTSLESL